MPWSIDRSESVDSQPDHGAAENGVAGLLQPRLRMERFEGCVFEAPIHCREEPVDLAGAERLAHDLA